MAVKILIRRQVPEGKEEELDRLLRKLRGITMDQSSGYVSGETLRRVDKPGETLVISTWRDVESWRNWMLSEERGRIQEEIDSLLGAETIYEIYRQ
jgi:heme oxygenase (mycobilin-producing)